MSRRDFIKGLAGLYAACTTFFSYKYFKVKSSKISKKTNKKGLKHIEFPICYHCDLNCASCDHFSPLAPVYEMPVDIFEKDIKQLKKLTKGSLEEIFLVGGEPLLNKNIEKIIKIARTNFPASKIIILTNGLSLENMKDSFWETIACNNVRIVVSNYISHKKIPNYAKINKMAEKHKAKFRVSDIKVSFDLINLSHNKLNDKTEKYYSCHEKINGAMLDNGVLYSCCIAQGMDKFFNSAFKDKAIPIGKEDTFNIFETESLDDIISFLNKPKTMCKYCHYHDNVHFPNKTDWKLSEKRLSEWYVE